MKALTLLLLASFLNTTPVWQTDFDKALQQAKQEHKYVLVNFSGSDWCIPCIKMHKEIFASETFASFANEHLEMVNADFPRLKKNQLSKEQQRKNEQLADRYNPNGNFPYTILVDEQGQVVKSWEGYSNMTPEEFTSQLKTLMNVR